MKQIAHKIMIGILLTQTLSLSAMDWWYRIQAKYPEIEININNNSNDTKPDIAFEMHRGEFKVQWDNQTPYDVVVYQKDSENAPEKVVAEVSAHSKTDSSIKIDFEKTQFSSGLFTALIKSEKPVKVPVETMFTQPTGAMLKSILSTLGTSNMSLRHYEFRDLYQKIMIKLPQ